MNKISRLTALLLALMMILSTFAAAETAYPVGGMTMEQWEQLMDQAQSELYTIDEGDAGKTITPESPEQAERGDYYPYVDGVALALADEAVSCQISASGVAVLTNASAGQWQMKIGSSWVNISGETDASLSVTGAMMNGMTSAEVRKALEPKDETTGEYTEYTAAATVEIVETAPALFSANRADDSTEDSNGEEAVLPYSLQRANEGATMYTVVVEYKFENGTTAAGSWGASVGAGTNLNEIVPNPNVVGYKPRTTVVINPTNAAGITYTPATVAAADDVANGIKIGDVTDPGCVNLDIIGIDQHITVTVTYEPTLVDYTVIHKQQNTDNDNYTEVERVTERGLTGSIVPDEHIARSYPGFYSLLYEQPTIAANGSTVVEISYDRYYYLISFELSGGYGVDPVYGRFGAEVGDVPDPIRPGYEFLGWNVEVPETIPAGHTVVTALWKPLGNFYTVVYWTQNVGEDEYSYWGQQSVASVSGTSLIPSEVGEANSAAKAGLDKAGYFKYDAQATAELNDDDKAIIVAGDGSTVVNVYYSRNSYTIRFIYARQEGDTYVLADLTGCGTYNNVHPSNANHTIVKTSWGSYKVDTAPVVNPAFADKTGSFKEDKYTYHYIYMTAEYGANLENIWPAAPLPKTGSYYFGSWGAQCGSPYRETYGNEHANIVGAYPVMSEELIMDPANPIAQTMVAWWAQSNANVSAHTYHIYFEVLPGQESDKEYNEVDYVHVSDIDFTCAHNGTTRVDPFDYAGFTCVNDTRDTSNDKQSNSNNYKSPNNTDCPNHGQDDQCAYCNVFYYKRDRYTLSFYNYNKESDKPADETLMFGQSISGCKPEAAPPYPEGVEPGALTFVGWYTTPEAYEGTEVDWNSTMPEGNVTLYAKWISNTYTVRFFLTEELMETGLDANVYMPSIDLDDDKAAIFREVPHGTQIDQEFVEAYLDYNAMTQNGGLFKPYTFIAWFYYDENGVKQPFEPATQIKQDLDVFAEWSSDVLVAYTIKYAVPKIENGVRVVDYYVSDDTTGSALAGTSKTFEAKGGADLWADYQTGCFPETESHTIRFETGDATTGVEYIFWYADKVKVPYKVFYVTAQQNDENSLDAETNPGIDGTYYRLKDPKPVDDNENAIVTETFETVSGYMPDAYQKRLIITNDGNPDNDVIIFIYTKDEQHAYYRVTHYIENLETDAYGNTTWTEYTSSQFVGDIGETTEYNDDPLQISGFKAPAETYVVGNVVMQGSPDNVAKLTEDGMQINLYYERELYPYKVQYLLENTTQELVPSKTGREKYEKTVTESAPTETDDPVLNQYELVTRSPQSLTIRIEEEPNGEPKLNIITFYYREKNATIKYEAVGPENAQNFGAVSPEQEQLGILSGVATGSVATAGEYCTFVGWYSDQACTTLLTNEARFVPTKAENTVWVDGTTYYAKFEYLPAQLDITKTVVNNTEEDLADMVFVFNVKLTNVYGHPLTGEVEYTIDGQPYTATLQDGSFSMKLDVGTVPAAVKQSSKTASIANLPHGVRYVVTEEAVENCTVTVENVSGSIMAGETVTATITNTFPAATVSTLTIKKNGMSNGESAVFKVELTTGTYMVVLNSENLSETILNVPIGSQYTVTELNSWSWRYENNASQTGTIQKDGNEAVFTNSRTLDKWMGDESWVENNATEGKQTNNLNNQ